MHVLHRLIYKSKIKEEHFTSLADILIKSIEYNTRDNITGLLVRTNKEFVQVLEGARYYLNQTFQRIVKDDRHSEIVIISYDPIVERSFNEWAMKGINFDNLEVELQSYLWDKYGSENSDFKVSMDSALAYSFLKDVSYHFQKKEIPN